MFRHALHQLVQPTNVARPGIRSLLLRQSFSSKSTPITRESFISPDHVSNAIAKPTMFKMSAEGLEEVPMPASIKETGVIPEGYSIDFVFDPSRMISVLAKQNITTLEQLSASELEGLKATLNSPDNLNIIPTPIYEMKQAITAQTDAESDE